MRNHVSPQAIYKPSIQNKLQQPDTQFNSEFESTMLPISVAFSHGN